MTKTEAIQSFLKEYEEKHGIKITNFSIFPGPNYDQASPNEIVEALKNFFEGEGKDLEKMEFDEKGDLIEK